MQANKPLHQQQEKCNLATMGCRMDCISDWKVSKQARKDYTMAMSGCNLGKLVNTMAKLASNLGMLVNNNLDYLVISSSNN